MPSQMWVLSTSDAQDVVPKSASETISEDLKSKHFLGEGGGGMIPTPRSVWVHVESFITATKFNRTTSKLVATALEIFAGEVVAQTALHV